MTGVKEKVTVDLKALFDYACNRCNTDPEIHEEVLTLYGTIFRDKEGDYIFRDSGLLRFGNSCKNGMVCEVEEKQDGIVFLRNKAEDVLFRLSGKEFQISCEPVKENTFSLDADYEIDLEEDTYDIYGQKISARMVRDEKNEYILFTHDGQQSAIPAAVIEKLKHELDVARYCDYIRQVWGEEFDGELKNVREIAEKMLDYIQTAGNEYENDQLRDYLDQEQENMEMERE